MECEKARRVEELNELLFHITKDYLFDQKLITMHTPGFCKEIDYASLPDCNQNAWFKYSNTLFYFVYQYPSQNEGDPLYFECLYSVVNGYLTSTKIDLDFFSEIETNWGNDEPDCYNQMFAYFISTYINAISYFTRKDAYASFGKDKINDKFFLTYLSENTENLRNLTNGTEFAEEISTLNITSLAIYTKPENITIPDDNVKVFYNRTALDEAKDRVDQKLNNHTIPYAYRLDQLYNETCEINNFQQKPKLLLLDAKEPHIEELHTKALINDIHLYNPQE